MSVCDCGGGRWLTELEEPPQLSEQSPSTGWNMLHVAVEEILFFSLSLSKTKSWTPVEFLSGGRARRAIFFSLSGTPGRHSTNQPTPPSPPPL